MDSGTIKRLAPTVYFSGSPPQPLHTYLLHDLRGAEFRSGLMARLGVPISELVTGRQPPLGADRAERLLDLMSELKPPEHDMSFYSEPMRLMIYDCWIALGGDELCQQCRSVSASRGLGTSYGR